MTIKELLAARQAELDAAKTILGNAAAENRDLTEDEEREATEHRDKAAAIKAQIEEAREAERRKAELQQSIEAEEAWSNESQKQLSKPANPTPTQSKPNVTGGEGSKEFSSFGEYCHLVRESANDPLTNGNLRKKLAAASGLNTVIDSEGGFLIPPQYATEILRKAYTTGQILSRVRRVPLQGNTYKMPYVNETSRADGSRWGGVSSAWVEEGGTVTASKPSFGQLSLTLKKLMAIGYITEEQAQDYGATGSLLLEAFSDEIMFRLENAIIRGTGAGQPKGVLNSTCLVTVSKETNQTADTLWGPNIVKMHARHWKVNPASTVWLIHKSLEPFMPSLVLEGRYGSASTAVDAVPLYFPASPILNTGGYGALYNIPVVPAEYCSAAGDLGDIMLCDFSQYILADKGGLNVAESMHVRFLNAENTYRVSYRADGAPWWAAALTPANGSDTLSPFVTLEAR